MKFYKINIIALLFFLSACSSLSKKQTPKTAVLWDELETIVDSNKTDYLDVHAFRASRTILTDLIHTKLEIRLDWKNSWLIGKATLSLKPHFYATDSLFLDAKGMEIKSIYLANNKLNFNYDSNTLRIKLDKFYNRNEKFDVVIDYIAKPNERALFSGEAITSDKGLYFINPNNEKTNVMPHVWTQGETESNSVWFPTIDSPNMKSTQEIYLTVDNKYKTLSNGKLVSSILNADGTRTDLWKQNLPHAPYLFMIGVGEFSIVRDSYKKLDGSLLDVNYYVEPAWEKHAKEIFGETPAMIKFFSDLTGIEFVWDKYHQMVVRDYVSGAMENTGAVIFGEFVYKTDRELLDENNNSIIAHELFHHWFGDLVTCESWSNLPLNESFANYSQYLWDEHSYGLDEADYNAELEKEGYFTSVQNGGHHNLIWYNYENKDQMFDAHSYNKGGRILHMLRNYLGDEAFFLGMKNYLKNNQFKAAEFHHLRQAFEEVSGEDLTWFFKQWFEGKAHPKLDIIISENTALKSVEIKVYQNHDLTQNPLFKIPLKVMVYDDSGDHLHSITLNKLEETFVLPVYGNLNNVIFDYQQCILGEFQETKSDRFYVNQYYTGKRYLARYNALKFGNKHFTDSSQQMIIDALNDSFWGIRNFAIEKSKELKGDFLNKAINKIKQLALSDSASAVRSSAILFLSENIHFLDLEDLCIKSLKNEKSYLVLSTALNLINKHNKKLGFVKAKELENEQSDKLKATIAQIYAGSKDTSCYSFFIRTLTQEKIQGYEAILCLNSFSVYMTKQSIEVQETILNTYKKSVEVGVNFINLYMPQNVEFFMQYLDEAIIKNRLDIDLLEKNKNFVEVVELNKHLKRQESLLNDLKNYYDQLDIK